jgi:hypothetical protein
MAVVRWFFECETPTSGGLVWHRSVPFERYREAMEAAEAVTSETGLRVRIVQEKTCRAWRALDAAAHELLDALPGQETLPGVG